MFGDAKMTTALLDRLTHHCEILETGNETLGHEEARSLVWILGQMRIGEPPFRPGLDFQRIGLCPVNRRDQPIASLLRPRKAQRRIARGWMRSALHMRSELIDSGALTNLSFATRFRRLLSGPAGFL